MSAPLSRAWRAAFVVGAVAAAVAVLFDLRYAREIERATRERVRARMAPFAGGLREAVQRRVGVIIGMRSFTEGRPTRAALNEEFPAYARGALAGTPGLRALEYIEGGKLTMIEPRAGNEAAVGFDLAGSRRPEVRADYARALEAVRPLVTGPVRLVEGGTGLLFRLRLDARPGFPEIATAVLDVPTILTEAGIPDARSGLRLAVLMRDGALLGGDSLAAAERPERVEIAVESVEWVLQGAPVEGWDLAMAGWRSTTRITLVALVLLLALVAFVIGMREDRLVREAERAGSALDLALRAGRMGIFSLDAGTQALQWSGAATLLFGFDATSVDDPIERAFALMPPEDATRLRQVVAATLRGDRDEYVEEYRVVPPDGPERHVLTLGRLERAPDGRPLRITGIISDITERHALEEQLRQAQRLESVGKLAGGVAHDFNNLLTAITGFAELARSRAAEYRGPAAEAIAEDLQQVMASAQRGANLTSQLLAFSRRAPAAPTRVDLSHAVGELRPILERLFAGRVEILADLADGLPEIRAEMGQLTQVVLNLLVHARDAMPDGGTVTVRTFHVPGGSGRRPLDAPPGPWVCLEVQDAGAPALVRQGVPVLDPYVDAYDEASGSGLGLAVVHGAAENAGGHITVQAAAGTGNVFRVYLPIWSDRP